MTLKFEYNSFRILRAFGFSNVKYKGTTFLRSLKANRNTKFFAFEIVHARVMRRIVLSFSGHATLSFVGVNNVPVNAWRYILSLFKIFSI